MYRDHIEYVEICKTIKKKAKEDIRKHNLDEIRETIEASKSLKKVRRTHSLGKNRMITLLDKQGALSSASPGVPATVENSVVSPGSSLGIPSSHPWDRLGILTAHA